MKPQKKRSLLVQAGWVVIDVISPIGRREQRFIPPTAGNTQLLLREAWKLYKSGVREAPKVHASNTCF